jgi:acetolactate synthase-1/2/3 large subunit
MLLFSDCYPAETYRHLPRQRVDQVELFRAVTKGSLPIAVDSAERSTRRAIQLAMEGRPGPVHLDLPDDVMQHEAAGLPESTPYARWDGAPDARHPAMQSLAATIRQATRPILVGGLGINRSQSEPQLQRLAETLQAPVLLTISAKGSIGDSHPLCGGTLMGSEAPHELLAASDLIITIGVDVVEFFEPGTWPYHQKVVNIDGLPHMDGLWRPVQELVGDIRASLEALQPLLSSRVGAPRILRLFVNASVCRYPSSTHLLPGQLCRCCALCAPNAILTTDAGQHKVFASRMWTCQQPLSYLTSSGLGTMGVAIPIAIAAKLRPQQPVVALTGDGGFLMRVSELETARRVNVPIVVVVFNDGYLNLIKMKQERQGYPVLGSQFAPVDFVRVAEGFGFHAASVDSETAMRHAVQQAMSSGEPWVIDAHIDPDGYV